MQRYHLSTTVQWMDQLRLPCLFSLFFFSHCMFSCFLPPKSMQARWIWENLLSVGVRVRTVVCLLVFQYGPAVKWRPVQAVSLSAPCMTAGIGCSGPRDPDCRRMQGECGSIKWMAGEQLVRCSRERQQRTSLNREGSTDHLTKHVTRDRECGGAVVGLAMKRPVMGVITPGLSAPWLHIFIQSTIYIVLLLSWVAHHGMQWLAKMCQCWSVPDDSCLKSWKNGNIGHNFKSVVA